MQKIELYSVTLCNILKQSVLKYNPHIELEKYRNFYVKSEKIEAAALKCQFCGTDDHKGIKKSYKSTYKFSKWYFFGIDKTDGDWTE